MHLSTVLLAICVGTSAFPHDLPSTNTDLVLLPRAGGSKSSSSKSGSKSKSGGKSSGTSSKYHLTEVPRRGDTGIYLDKNSETIQIYYGDKMAQHASHIEYHYKAFPRANRRFWPTAKDKAGKETKDKNRSRAMKGVKAKIDKARDEKKFASTLNEQGSSDDQETVMSCSRLESNIEGSLKSAADKIHEKGIDGVGKGWRMEPIDHRSDDKHDVQGVVMKGYPDVEGFENPQQYTLTPKRKDRYVDPADQQDPADYYLSNQISSLDIGKGKQRQRRENIVDDVATTQGDPEHAESEGEESEDFKNYLTPFEEAQKKAVKIVTPILHDMVAGSTASQIYDAALSIYADLTYYPVSVIGPFHNGENDLDDREEQYKEDLDGNKDLKPEDRTGSYDNLLAFNGVLILKYERAWKKATEALDKDQLREEMPNLAGFLDVANEKAIPKEQLEVNKDFKEIDFLLPDKDGNYGDAKAAPKR